MVATSPQWSEDDILRWPLPANGEVGEPSAVLMLGAAVGDVRVVVSTAAPSWYPEPAVRFVRAAHLMSVLLLPSKPSAAEFVTRFADAHRWTATHLDVDGELHPVMSFGLDHHRWVTVAPWEPDVISVAVSSPGPIEVGVRTLTDWSGHGVDLSRPQPPAAFAAEAREVNVAWRGEGNGEPEPR